jgi:prepilin-type N-terminal cleavage/methylation domain-containing protein
MDGKSERFYSMNESPDIRKRAGAHGQAGFSLMELLIAMTVMVVIMAAIFACLKDSFQISATSYELSDAQQSLRAAHEYINRDLITAGDGLNGINNIRVPVQFVQGYLTQSPVLDPNDPGYMELSLIVSDDNVPGGTPVLGTNPQTNVLAGTDRITILETDRTFTNISLPAEAINASGSGVSISPADINLFRIGEIYFIAAGAKATLGVVTNIGGTNTNPTLVFADGDVYGLNHQGVGGPINFVSEGGTLPTTLMRMNIAHYFVNSDGLFVRRLFGVAGAGFKDTVIAEHFTDLQFRYLLSLRDANDQMQQPVSRLETSVQQTATRQVEISLKVRTAHAINDGQPKSLSMTTATSIRNMQFRLAQ